MTVLDVNWQAHNFVIMKRVKACIRVERDFVLSVKLCGFIARTD